MTATLIILVGLPGAGKSDYRESHKDFNAVEVSTDDIRLELFNVNSKQEYQEKCFDGKARHEGTNDQLVFATAKNRIRKNLKEGVNVIFEAINIKEAAVANFIKIAQECGAEIKAYHFYCPLWELLRRNSLRGEANRDFDRFILESYYSNALNLETGEMKLEWPTKYDIHVEKKNTLGNPKWQ
ncbi:MAG: ATP-binding protein [Coriobacteriales bacterium]|jgi:predicted kinase|nr:ATP-binding protein [Coriobacteriales bacterium]